MLVSLRPAWHADRRSAGRPKRRCGRASCSAWARPARCCDSTAASCRAEPQRDDGPDRPRRACDASRSTRSGSSRKSTRSPSGALFDELLQTVAADAIGAEDEVRSAVTDSQSAIQIVRSGAAIDTSRRIARSLAAERRRLAKIISTHSFRGGTGKSNTTANLAVLVARAGHRVGVIDTDIQSPGIHVIFQLAESRVEHALNDYLWGKCAIEEAAYDVTDAAIGNVEPDGDRPRMFLIPSSVNVGEIGRSAQGRLRRRQAQRRLSAAGQGPASSTTCSSTRIRASTKRRCCRSPSPTC